MDYLEFQALRRPLPDVLRENTVSMYQKIWVRGRIWQYAIVKNGIVVSEFVIERMGHMLCVPNASVEGHTRKGLKEKGFTRASDGAITLYASRLLAFCVVPPTMDRVRLYEDISEPEPSTIDSSIDLILLCERHGAKILGYSTSRHAADLTTHLDVPSDALTAFLGEVPEYFTVERGERGEPLPHLIAPHN